MDFDSINYINLKFPFMPPKILDLSKFYLWTFAKYFSFYIKLILHKIQPQ